MSKKKNASSVRARRSPPNEDLFALLVASVKDYAIFLLDPHGRVATWNPGAERIKGYRADEIIGEHFSIFYRDEDSHRCDAELEIAASEGRFEDEGWRVRKDGTQFWANVVISAVRDHEGKLVGFSKVTRDSTERKRAQEEQAARNAAEQANRAKDEFLAMLGHELRNPLAPILTALQLMKLRSDQAVSREQLIIERQVRHMMRLVDDLLDIAQITRGAITLRRLQLDVRTAIAKAIEVASPLLEQRRHHLSVDVPPHPIIVEGDEARLTQMFANVLLNAAKHTDPAGHIAVTLELVDDEVVVEVRDDGRGIEPELLPKIFDLFVQGQQSSDRSAGGLGIGLALVRTLVQLHKGKVEAYSGGAGKGSTFTIRLPVATGHVPESAVKMDERTFNRGPRTRRILLVDDNEDALELMTDVLTGVGHEVIAAPDAPAALHAVKGFKPDVAILDIGLPVMDGYALAEQLRVELRPHPPRMIALTGYGQQSDRTRSMNAGFDAHLVKPVDTQRLLDTIIELDH